jgi:hypothetical protein
MYILEWQDISEEYDTMAEAKQAQRELNEQGMTGSSIDTI